MENRESSKSNKNQVLSCIAYNCVTELNMAIQSSLQKTVSILTFINFLTFLEKFPFNQESRSMVVC